MNAIIMRVLLRTIALLMPVLAHAADIDKKLFCKDLSAIVKAFSSSADSLKGKFIGENTLGIRQWMPKHILPAAVSQFYEHAVLETSEEYRATYILVENVQQKEAEDLYKQVVAAVRWCYEVDYFLNEKQSTEWDNSGKKHQHHEATFTFTGAKEKGIIMPVILVRSFAIESGLYSVTVELYSIR